MPRVLIVADDLTGAADTGAQFARRGWRTLLVLPVPPELRTPEGAPGWYRRPLCPSPRLPSEGSRGVRGSALEPGQAAGAEVLVLSTDSRALPDSAAAAAAVNAALAGISLSDFPLVYKKVDSTLRGYPAAELAALLASLGEINALIAPAFPAQGRTTRGGAVLIHGVPFEQTSFGAERGSAPCTPVRVVSSPPKGGSGDLTRLFGGTSTAPLLPIDTVRKGLMAIRMVLEGKTGPWIADAETDGDLRRLAQAALDLGLRVLCGSAGLANALADCLGPGPAAGEQPNLPSYSAPGAVLAVAGSLHPATAAQVQAACRQGALLIQPPAEFFAAAGPAGVAETAARLAAALARGGPVILATLPPSGGDAALPPPLTQSGLLLQASFAIDAGSAARKLAQAAVQAMARSPTAGLFLTGGDTAREVCRELGGTRLWLGGEVEPGMPWARLADGLYQGMKVVTKAGAFGGEESSRWPSGF